MTKVKTNFSYHRVDVGLDVHKRSWNAAVFLDGVYVRNIHQPPSPKALHAFLTSYFPGADYHCAYECGKFGFWIQRQFSELNIDCFVVNPADIPSTHKDEVYKNDCRDARGIGDALAKGQLRSIYVPSPEQEADRHLVRMRKKIWRRRRETNDKPYSFVSYFQKNMSLYIITALESIIHRKHLLAVVYLV